MDNQTNNSNPTVRKNVILAVAFVLFCRIMWKFLNRVNCDTDDADEEKARCSRDITLRTPSPDLNNNNNSTKLNSKPSSDNNENNGLFKPLRKRINNGMFYLKSLSGACSQHSYQS